MRKALWAGRVGSVGREDPGFDLPQGRGRQDDSGDQPDPHRPSGRLEDLAGRHRPAALGVRRPAGARACPAPAWPRSTPASCSRPAPKAVHDAYDVMLIDTPAAPDSDVAVAVNSADLCVLVCAPHLPRHRLGGALGRDGPAVGQGGADRAEPGAVQARRLRTGQRAAGRSEALRFCGLPIAPIGLRSRAIYQQSIARGLSVGEGRRGPGRPGNRPSVEPRGGPARLGRTGRDARAV